MLVLSDQQGQAVDAIARAAELKGASEPVVLAGFAGSGKTSIAPNIINVLGARAPLFCAPTNKAAKVLTEKGLEAISLHKAMYHPPGEKDPPEVEKLKQQLKDAFEPEEVADLKARLEALLASVGDPTLTWRINPEGPAAMADLIMVDEGSMVGSQLGADLMSFGKPVIAIGDPGQLPPVKDTPFFALNQPDFLLTEIHRQARDNPIIALSKDIREGKPLTPGRRGNEVIIARKNEIEIPDNVEDMPQVIVGTHRRRWHITDAIRGMLGFEGSLPNAGEPLIVRKNSMSHGAMINGAEAMCGRAVKANEDFTIDIELTVEGTEIKTKVWDGPFREHDEREAIYPRRLSNDWAASMENERVDFGWAITCHVSQGSQWDDVLVYDESRAFREDAARWLYTAATRAAKQLSIVV